MPHLVVREPDVVVASQQRPRFQPVQRPLRLRARLVQKQDLHTPADTGHSSQTHKLPTDMSAPCALLHVLVMCSIAAIAGRVSRNRAAGSQETSRRASVLHFLIQHYCNVY